LSDTKNAEPIAKLVDKSNKIFVSCEEDNCSDYRGNLAVTKEGYACDQWPRNMKN
jgi:hypothetical protein